MRNFLAFKKASFFPVWASSSLKTLEKGQEKARKGQEIVTFPGIAPFSQHFPSFSKKARPNFPKASTFPFSQFWGNWDKIFPIWPPCSRAVPAQPLKGSPAVTTVSLSPLIDFAQCSGRVLVSEMSGQASSKVLVAHHSALKVIADHGIHGRKADPDF